MMETVFLKLLNMSITASWLVLVVIVFRLILKKAPKAFNVILWAFVAIRLICPFSFESFMSLVPSTETIPEDIMYSKTPTVQTGIDILNTTVNPIISESLAPNNGDSVNPMQIIVFLSSWIWIIGMVVMIVYAFISYWNIHRKVREAVLVKENIWICDRIDTPFILGVIKPCIYLPSSMNEQDMEYVIAHENAHIKRYDHWWKPIGFALLTIYWFNPILWIAYVLLCRDIELACDEKVIKELGVEIKKHYSEALINCSISTRAITACPLAFGEVGVKERVKTILNYKKPAFWVIIIAIVASVIVGVCFLTNPKEDEKDNETPNNNLTVTVGTSPYTGVDLGPETLTKEDTDTIISILDTEKWEDTDNRLISDFVFIVGEKTYSYSIIEGLFIDHIENKCVYLLEETKLIVNNIVDKYLYSDLPPENVTMWFEHYNNWEDETLVSELSGLSGVTFEYKDGNIIISDENGIVRAIGGMAETCKNGYFYDLTNDGIPELCLTMNVGSGIIDSRILVYDYVTDSLHALEDRGDYDYSLLEEYDRLLVTKKKYATEEITAEGRLSIGKDSESGEIKLLFSLEKIPNANKTLTPGTYLAGSEEYVPPTSSSTAGTAYFKIEKTGDVSVGQSFFIPSADDFSYDYNGEQLVLTVVPPSGGSVEVTIFVFDINENGCFVYNKNESTVPAHNQFFEDGMVFGLMPENEE